jgi:hypothetical protein
LRPVHLQPIRPKSTKKCDSTADAFSTPTSIDWAHLNTSRTPEIGFLFPSVRSTAAAYSARPPALAELLPRCPESEAHGGVALTACVVFMAAAGMQRRPPDLADVPLMW